MGSAVNDESLLRKRQVLTETESNKFSDYLAEQMKDPEFAAAYKEVSAAEDARLAEIRRLERAVIEKTKAARRAQKIFLENITLANATTHYETWEDRDRATDDLLDFESQQIKK